jgi:hypothetical protein
MVVFLQRRDDAGRTYTGELYAAILQFAGSHPSLDSFSFSYSLFGGHGIRTLRCIWIDAFNWGIPKSCWGDTSHDG